MYEWFRVFMFCAMSLIAGVNFNSLLTQSIVRWIHSHSFRHTTHTALWVAQLILAEKVVTNANRKKVGKHWFKRGYLNDIDQFPANQRHIFFNYISNIQVSVGRLKLSRIWRAEFFRQSNNSTFVSVEFGQNISWAALQNRHWYQTLLCQARHKVNS